MIRSVRLQSLAKANLDLRVLYKRTDGFHELRTVFQTISLADRLGIEFEAAPRTDLRIDGALEIPDNLVVRAARAVLDALKMHGRVRFHLEKRIPLGGGLGGGSSNAAAVLLALPVLAGKRLSFERLMSLGAGLGSDVPFFLTGGTAVGLGRGTEVYELSEMAAQPVLVVVSGIHVSTALAYQALGRALESDAGSLTSPALSRKISDFQLFVRTLRERRSAGAASILSANDFEAAVFSQQPLLKAMWGRLRKQAGAARMTGSGSALFALFESRTERDRVGKILERDRVMKDCRLLPANLVSRNGYRRLWRRQLVEHVAQDGSSRGLWPPPSRHER